MSQPEEQYTSPTTESIIKDTLAQWTSDDLDILIKEWLSSKEAIFRKIGAYALGQMRFSRAVPHLIKSLENTSEDIDVLQEISKALGRIGGSDAVRALLRHERIEPIAYALGDLDDFEIYDDSLQKLFQLLKKSDEHEHMQTRLLVYRAIGLKKDKRYTNDLKQLLHGAESALRGT